LANVVTVFCQGCQDYTDYTLITPIQIPAKNKLEALLNK